MFDFRRSHDCGALKKEDIGQSVTLSGWVHRRRDHGGVIFIDLRDRFGLTQLVIDPHTGEKLYAMANQLRQEWVISVKGKVIARQEGMSNPKMKTGDIEIDVNDLDILSKSKVPPFTIADENLNVNDELRLKYRYLDMRRGPILDNLILRHKTMMCVRKFMDNNQFVEVTTPLLGKSTPEGSRDYLVPSRIHPGHFYALPQSPQLFKQILMVGGLDRYFQIAPCLRDEDLRADRQPEFSQIDMEMSFATKEELFKLVEGLMHSIFKECRGLEIQTPFRHITHHDCLENYGTDKPDLRFGMSLKTIDDIAKHSTGTLFIEAIESGNTVKGFCVKGGADLSRKTLEDYVAFVNLLGVKGVAWMKRQGNELTTGVAKFFPVEQQAQLIERFDMQEGDLLLIVADEKSLTNKALDHLRRRIAKERNLIKPDHFEFLWVTEFPLFNWNAEEQRIESEHHPFTSPLFEDIHLLKTDPLKVRSLSYDLVLNGYELASGSQRIHNGDLQQTIFEQLKLTADEINQRFGFFIEALSYGTPPHLGAALGFDRIIMLLIGTDNIREVIAFPKTQKATDLMMEAPSDIPEKQLKELKLRILS
ncbi:MAG: aspartate--tRNA ligase [Parachlamydiales bacterium]|nr:aspartate--tRNA ligase [Parachlamydiales bacterium]